MHIAHIVNNASSDRLVIGCQLVCCNLVLDCVYFAVVRSKQRNAQITIIVFFLVSSVSQEMYSALEQFAIQHKNRTHLGRWRVRAVLLTPKIKTEQDSRSLYIWNVKSRADWMKWRKKQQHESHALFTTCSNWKEDNETIPSVIHIYRKAFILCGK